MTSIYVSSQGPAHGDPVKFVGTLWAQKFGSTNRKTQKTPAFTVVGTGVDPVTSRFSGARSTY
jgi:hypothetical protein